MDFKERTKLKIAISKIEEEENAMSKNNNLKIKKGIGMVACLIILFSGIVYAKDIEQFIKSLFINSTEAIDLAVENGYVQQNQMNYVYDNGIGIKVDNLVLDDLNLDISFNFETEIDDIKLIRFNDFVIKTDNEKIVYQSEFKYAETPEELPLYNSVTWMNEPIKVTDTVFTDSILLGLRQEKEELKKLYFDVKSLNITYTDDRSEQLEGSWKFDIAINEEMRKSINIEYVLSGSNEYVENCTGILFPTGMIVNVNFTSLVRLDEITVDVVKSLYLNNDDNKYLPEYMERDYDNNGIILHYNNIGTFSHNIDTLELNLELYDTSIILKKKL